MFVVVVSSYVCMLQFSLLLVCGVRLVYVMGSVVGVSVCSDDGNGNSMVVVLVLHRGSSVVLALLVWAWWSHQDLG